MNTVYPSTETKKVKAKELPPGKLWWHNDSEKRMFVRIADDNPVMKKNPEVPKGHVISFEPATGQFVITAESSDVYMASDFTVMATNA